MGAQERGDAAVVTRAGKMQAEAVAVICSGWARRREVRWRQSFAVGGHGERGGGERSKAWLLMGERRGGMKQNNYQPVR